MGEFGDMVERGTKAWADVPNTTEWVDDLRGSTQTCDSLGICQSRNPRCTKFDAADGSLISCATDGCKNNFLK